MRSEIQGLPWAGVVLVPALLTFVAGVYLGSASSEFECPPSTLQLQEVSYTIAEGDNGEAEEWLTEFATNVKECASE